MWGMATQGTGVSSGHWPKHYRCSDLTAPFAKSHLMQDNQHVAVSHDMDGTHDVIEDVNTTSIYDYIVNSSVCYWMLFTIRL